MNGECSKKALMLSVLSVNCKTHLINMHETLKTTIKDLTDDGAHPADIMDPEKYNFYIARENRMLRISTPTLCRAMGDLFREEGIGCDI
jgi:hypothetical protein